MTRERPVLVETLFADPVWLCSVGLGCVCGDGCDASPEPMPAGMRDRIWRRLQRHIRDREVQ